MSVRGSSHVPLLAFEKVAGAVPAKSLVNFRKPGERTMQDK